MKNFPRIGVLILNLNGKNWLETLYPSLLNSKYPDLQIYLVDNNSTDGSVEYTIQNFPDVKVIKFPKNLGYSEAYNITTPIAFEEGCKRVVWCNNDIILEENCLQSLVRSAEKKPSTGIAGPAFLNWEGKEPNEYMKGNYPLLINKIGKKNPGYFEVNWVEGSFFMIKKECYKDVGPLDPYYFLYWEEVDYCRRARKKGWKVILVPDALVRHYEKGTKNKERNLEKIMNFYLTKNQYSYLVSDPKNPFLMNLLKTLHNFGINIKREIFSPYNIPFHTNAFLAFVSDLFVLYKKRKQDIKGILPSPVNKNRDLREFLYYKNGSVEKIPVEKPLNFFKRK